MYVSQAEPELEQTQCVNERRQKFRGAIPGVAVYRRLHAKQARGVLAVAMIASLCATRKSESVLSYVAYMHPQPISKTAFLDFLFCPKNLWLKLHRPELLEKFRLRAASRRRGQRGGVVRAQSFPQRHRNKSVRERSVSKTTKLVTAKVPAIFQATFIIDGFLRATTCSRSMPKATPGTCMR